MDNSTKIIVGAGAGVAVVVAWEFYPQKNNIQARHNHFSISLSGTLSLGHGQPHSDDTNSEV